MEKMRKGNSINCISTKNNNNSQLIIMAEGKNSFLLYTDIIHTVRKLPKDKAGELFLHILEYVNDLNPVTDDFAVEIAFEPIKQNLIRNLKSYKETVQKNSESGRIGNLKKWHIDLYEKYSSNELTLEECEKVAKDRKRDKITAKHRDRDKNIAIIADNGNGNDSDNDILLKKETKEENILKDNEEELFSEPETDPVKTEEEKTSKKIPKKKVPSEESKIKIFFFKNALIDYGFDKDLIDHFIAVRKKKGLVNTEVAFKMFIREIEKTGKDINEVFKIITQKQWGGFEAKWLNNVDNGQSNSFKTKSNGNGLRQSIER